MSPRKKQPFMPEARIKVDSKDQRYLLYGDGQMRRLSEQGTPLPRIRMTKKDRLRLRREYADIKDLTPVELASKITETPVVNPLVAVQPETEIKGA